MTINGGHPMLTRREFSDERKTYTDYAQSDRKGRRFGLRITRSIVTFTEVEDGVTSGYRFEPGTYYAARVQTARDGIGFGACQPHNYFKTEAEREAYIAKRIADGQKLALRNAGK
jgi:hypothetical protein